MKYLAATWLSVRVVAPFMLMFGAAIYTDTKAHADDTVCVPYWNSATTVCHDLTTNVYLVCGQGIPGRTDPAYQGPGLCAEGSRAQLGAMTPPGLP